MVNETDFSNMAADDLYSTDVSIVRQPIESLFNGPIEKTDIQRATKVRFTKDPMVSYLAGSLIPIFF